MKATYPVMLSQQHKARITGTAPPITPASYSGLIGWWKSDSLALNDNDLISTWADSSTTGNNATAAGAARPTYKANIIAGKPAVRFGGTQYLTLSAAATFTNYTFIAVSTSELANYGVIAGSSGVAVTRFAHYHSSRSLMASVVANVGSVTSDYLSCLTNVAAMRTFRGTGTSGTYRENDWSVGAVTTGSPGQLNKIGGYDTNYYVVDVYEILIYNTVLTDSQVDALFTNYFKSRYALRDYTARATFESYADGAVSDPSSLTAGSGWTGNPNIV